MDEDGVNTPEVVKQILSKVVDTIIQHDWQNLTTLLPPMILTCSDYVSKKFLWNCIHIILCNCNFSLNVQELILRNMFLTKMRPSQVMLEWIGQFPLQFSEDKLINITQLAKEIQQKKIVFARNCSENSKEDYSIALYESYCALIFYMKWKKCCVQLEELQHIAMETDEEEMGAKLSSKNTECKDLLKSAYNLLLNAFKKVKMFSNQAGCNCEWILEPLLETERQYNAENLSYKNYLKKGVDEEQPVGEGEIDEAMGEAMEFLYDYISNNTNSLPSLKFTYYFIRKHYPAQKSTLKRLMKEIIIKSPDDPLVIDYIEGVLRDGNCKVNPGEEAGVNEFKDSEHNNSKDTTCYFNNFKVSHVFKSLRLIVGLLEYKTSSSSLRAWNTLTQILIYFHFSWIE